MSNDSGRMSYKEYREQVVRSAESIIEETIENEGDMYGLTSDPFLDALREETQKTVNHHEWIIYTGYQVAILANADSNPNEYEWELFVQDPDENDWRDYVRAMARVAFEADIWEVVERKHSEAVEQLEDLRIAQMDQDARAEIEAERKLEEQYARHVDEHGWF